MASPIFPTADSSRPSVHLTTASAHSNHILLNKRSSASSVLSKSRKSLQTTPEGNDRGRKRARQIEDVSKAFAASGQPQRNIRPVETDQVACEQFQEPESPMPMTNTHYELAGGLDTPCATRLDEEEEREMALQMADYRINRYSSRNTTYGQDNPLTPLFSGGGPRGRKRERSTDAASWGRVVLNAVGGVAGKVIDFCWTNGTFGGFQAGGGKAYPTDLGTPAVVEQSTWSRINEGDDVFKSTRSNENPMTNSIPGQFPEEEFIQDYMTNVWSYNAGDLSTPAPSRPGGHSLDGNWVFVKKSETLDNDITTRQSQVGQRAKETERRQPTFSPMMRASRAQLKPSRAALAGSPGSRLNRPASFASPRASPGRLSTTRIEGDWSAGGTDTIIRARAATPSPRRAATHAVTRKSCGTPTSPEYQRYEKRMRRMEKQEDESLTRLNNQLQSLIKEGKEALGTTFEVNVLDDEWT